MSINKVIIMGRITKELEIRFTTGGTGVLKFSVAVDRKVKQGEEKQADFINCVAFGKTSEFISKYFEKGSSIIVIGRIQTGSYEGNNGKVYTTDVVVEEVNFAGGKKKEGQPQQQPQVNENNSEGFFPVGEDEELPF